MSSCTAMPPMPSKGCIFWTEAGSSKVASLSSSCPSRSKPLKELCTTGQRVSRGADLPRLALSGRPRCCVISCTHAGAAPVSRHEEAVSCSADMPQLVPVESGVRMQTSCIKQCRHAEAGSLHVSRMQTSCATICRHAQTGCPKDTQVLC